MESDPEQRFLRGAAEHGYPAEQAEQALAEARAERDQPGSWATTVYEAAIWRLAESGRRASEPPDGDGPQATVRWAFARGQDGGELQAHRAGEFPSGDQIDEALEDFDPAEDFGDFRERTDPLIHAFTKANPGLHTVQAIGYAVRVDVLETPLLYATLDLLVAAGSLILGNHPDGPLYGAAPRDSKRRPPSR